MKDFVKLFVLSMGLVLGTAVSLYSQDFPEKDFKLSGGAVENVKMKAVDGNFDKKANAEKKVSNGAKDVNSSTTHESKEIDSRNTKLTNNANNHLQSNGVLLNGKKSNDDINVILTEGEHNEGSECSYKGTRATYSWSSLSNLTMYTVSCGTTHTITGADAAKMVAFKTADGCPITVTLTANGLRRSGSYYDELYIYGDYDTYNNDVNYTNYNANWWTNTTVGRTVTLNTGEAYIEYLNGYSGSSTWTITVSAPCKYTITYNTTTNCASQAVSVPPTNATDCEGHATISNVVPNPCNGTNVFIGWNTNSSGTGTMYNPSEAITLTGNLTLYAIYRDCRASSLRISMNGTLGDDGIYYYNYCEGGSAINLRGSLDAGSAASWRWYINPHNGSPTVATTQNTTYTPPIVHGYDITLTAKDANGCPAYAYGRIRVSGGLSVPAQASPAPNGVCQGSVAEIAVGDAEGAEIQIPSEPHTVTATLGESNVTFIPDGPNCTEKCYESPVTFNDFSDAALVSTVNDINYVKINMEHTFIGDVQIKLTCPNGQSAIILPDYYSNTTGSEHYNSGAIDPATYDWPGTETVTTYWMLRNSGGRYVAWEDFGIVNVSVYDALTANGTNSRYDFGDGYEYWLSFSTESEATNFLNTYFNPDLLSVQYRLGRYIIVYSNNGTDYFLTLRMVYDDGDDNIMVFQSEDAARDFQNNVVNISGSGFTSLTRVSISNTSYGRVFFGEPDWYDIGATYDACDIADEHNLHGIGYDYVWTSNSNYTTVGKVYDPANIVMPSTYYNNETSLSSSSMPHVKPSILGSSPSQIYEPEESFGRLIGCPLNGTWTISVCDSWEKDNGYVFSWELSLSERYFPDPWDYDIYVVRTIVSDNDLGVSDVSDPNEDGAIIRIEPPANFSGDNQHVNIQVVDNLGCVTSSPIEVDFAVTERINAIVNDAYVCQGGSTSLSAEITGSNPGVSPFTYSWSNGSTTNPLSLNNVSSDASYSVTVTDASGCVSSAEASVFIGNPTATVSGGGTICSGEPTSFTIEFTGNPPYNYTWSDGSTNHSATTSASSVSVGVTPTVPTTYTVTQLRDSRCTSGFITGSAVFNVNPKPAVAIEAASTTCPGATVNLTGRLTTTTTANYTYTWSAASGMTLSSASNGPTTATSVTNTATAPTGASVCGNSYQINLHVQDARGCTADATPINILVNDGVKPTIAVATSSNPNGACNPGTITAPTFTYTDNCTGTGTVTNVTTTGSSHSGCDYTQTWKANYTDACGNAADEVSVTYTWKQDTEKPVIATTAVSGDKGCNPTITAPTFTGTDNCEGGISSSITVDTDGATHTGCHYSQTWTAT